MTAKDSSTPQLAFSPTESARFGLRIFRANLEQVDACALRAELESARADVAILRIPAHALASVHELSGAGLRPMIADTLVHYSGVLDQGAVAAPRNPSLRLKLARDVDADALATMARTIFANYVSHYHANPLFDANAIADGYAEWAARCVPANDAGYSASFIELSGTAVGFSCMKICAATNQAHGVLNGVMPAARRSGVYRDMLRATLAQLAAAGIARFFISTQVHNVIVQRVWADEGLRLDRAENTVHLSPLFNRGRNG